LISVVIPTTGRASIRSVLAALADQREPPPFEVVVGVDGGVPPTHDDIRRHPGCVRVDVVVLPRRQGVSAARNAALARARGALIGFLDDDVIPAPDWLRQLDARLARFDAVAGRIVEDEGPGVLSRLRRLAFDHRHRVNLAHGGPVDYLNGGNFGARSPVLNRAGRFDPRYVKSQDRELARRIAGSGGVIGYAPELIVEHRGHYTIGGLIRGRYRAGRAAATMARDGGPVSVGPLSTTQTYGASVPGLLRRHGVALAACAAVSTIAHRLGRTKPWPG